MLSLRDFVIFLAGAQFFHTLSHLLMSYFVVLPLQMKFFELTPVMNFWATIVNGVITLLLLWWAHRLSKNKPL